MTEILIYTRKPKDEYTESLANSVHLACGFGEAFEPLNQNYGILFAEAVINDDNTICEKGLIKPHLFRTQAGLFGITAIRVGKDGVPDNDEESRGKVLLWTSPDLITFNYHGLIPLTDTQWKEPPEQSNLLLKDINPGNILSLEPDVAAAAIAHWTPLFHVETRYPKKIQAATFEELEAIKATAVYSDGSAHDKKVQWDTQGIDFSTSGTYPVKGKIVTPAFPFPLAPGYADPVILPWDGRYFYLATNDNKNDIGLYAREADTVEGLFAPDFKESLLLDVDEERDFIQTFWAPEFHQIGGDLYILLAIGGRKWAPQCHMMKLKKDGSIMNPADWETPVRVKKQDGSFLTESGISLDMTYFKADGTSCLVWSYRFGIGTPRDTGSMIYIATVDENEPCVLTSEPILLTRPVLGWENIQGTINNEGPYPLITDDWVHIAYSGGAAGGYTYAVGLLSIPRGSDFLNAELWKKSSTPLLHYRSVEDVNGKGIYGPGHNSFYTDYDGNVMIAYHGEETIVGHGTRCSAIHRVHFRKDKSPVFNMSPKRDLDNTLAAVSAQVLVIQENRPNVN